MSGKQTDVADEIKSEATVEKLKVFDPADVSEISGIRVVDVGQGDCIGVLNENDEVFCYVDFGGFNDHPEKGKTKKKDPSAKRMPARLNGKHVTIFLTHWDKDHFWSVDKKNTDARDCQWIVPRQYVSPQGLRVAEKLNNAKRWPESKGKKAVDFQVGKNHRIVVRKCRPFVKNPNKPDRNHTGLAVTLVESNADGDKAVMILPGDCPFDQIPNCHSPTPIKAIVAYHHGADAHWDSIATKQAIDHRATNYQMVYSFGSNKYGHPGRQKYKPHWNSNRSETPTLRVAGKRFVDCKW